MCIHGQYCWFFELTEGSLKQRRQLARQVRNCLEAAWEGERDSSLAGLGLADHRDCSNMLRLVEYALVYPFKCLADLREVQLGQGISLCTVGMDTATLDAMLHFIRSADLDEVEAKSRELHLSALRSAPSAKYIPLASAVLGQQASKDKVEKLSKSIAVSMGRQRGRAGLHRLAMLMTTCPACNITDRRLVGLPDIVTGTGNIPVFFTCCSKQVGRRVAQATLEKLSGVQVE
ncbi:hypothetical protein CHLRE_17g746447v5 [Chlamydomonas reinhardtii]|uniref:Uncharacterized protein n=1 Tax=Chlamydomonas reinhardtii TaxID=3055 RepID=A0A2K3CS32_CHLRE|nr:uncharacterized protein CHLRE_17g746447v5 [Chlamydomonas reinhardtii]PNW71096.1 hypothetical protein CHLRE_17g746447v5 [Chlamydomonas reinhardtii]